MGLKKIKKMIGIKPYYENESGVLYHADCMSILKHIPDRKIDLYLTDPPYEKEAHVAGRRTRALLEKRSPYVDIPFDCMNEKLRQFIVNNSLRITNGWALVFCQAEAVGMYASLYGKAYKRPMIWVKPDGCPQFSGDCPGMGYESIVASWCKKGRSTWNGGGKRGVFTYNSTGYKHIHPTQKPLKLIIEMISLFSQEGSLIIDPFIGGGTTAIASHLLGRKWIGIEISKDYCEKAAKRIETETKKPSLFNPYIEVKNKTKNKPLGFNI